MRPASRSVITSRQTLVARRMRSSARAEISSRRQKRVASTYGAAAVSLSSKKPKNIRCPLEDAKEKQIVPIMDRPGSSQAFEVRKTEGG
jgi:hypothetical protein